MASEQDLDSQHNIQDASSGATASNHAQEGNEGSSRTRYPRKAKKDVASVETDVEDKQDTKKATTGQAKSTKKRAKMEPEDAGDVNVQCSLNLPLDIWILIAEQVDPVSLLQLTRINKTLRNLLTTKRTSKGIWKKHIDRLNLPKLEHEDGRDIAFISFVYDRGCTFCDGDQPECEDWRHRIRWHDQQTCGKKMIIAENMVASKVTKLHSETLECVVPTLYPRGYILSQLVAVNQQINATTSTPQRAKVVNSLKEQTEKLVRDGRTLSSWANRSHTELYDDLLKRLGPDYVRRDLLAVGRKSQLGPVALNDQEWHSISASFTQAVAASKEERQQLVRRDSLKDQYNAIRQDQLSNTFDIFPPFKSFVELPSIKALWQPYSAAVFGDYYLGYSPSSRIENVGSKWITALPAIKAELNKAIRWYKIGYARIMASTLNDVGQPLPAALFACLNPPNSPVSTTWQEIKPAEIDFEDPATISIKALDELLNRYSTQAWYKEGKQALPGHFSHHLPSEYTASFPRFHPYWHNVLLQALEVVDFSDGPLGETAQRLDGLGSNFFCGECERPNGVRLSTLLRHLQTHPIPSTNKPSKQLIIYKDPNAPSDATPQASSSNPFKVTASSTKKRASKGKN